MRAPLDSLEFIQTLGCIVKKFIPYAMCMFVYVYVWVCVTKPNKSEINLKRVPFAFFIYCLPPPPGNETSLPL